MNGPLSFQYQGSLFELRKTYRMKGSDPVGPVKLTAFGPNPGDPEHYVRGMIPFDGHYVTIDFHITSLIPGPVEDVITLEDDSVFTTHPELIALNSEIASKYQMVDLGLDSTALTYDRKGMLDNRKDFCHDGIYRLGGPCPVCQRPFQTASGISNHMRDKHPNY